MRRWSAILLYLILAVSILTIWIPARWPVSILEIGSLSLALGWIVRLGLSSEPVRVSPLLAPLGLIVVWGGLQLLLQRTVAPSETLRATLGWATCLALVFVVLQTFDSRGAAWFLRCFLAFGFTLAVLSTLQTFTSDGKVFWLFAVPAQIFLMGPFLNHAHYAAFVELLLPLALIPATQSPVRRVYYGLMTGFLIASVVAAATRAGFVLIVIETACVLLLIAWRGLAGMRRIALTFAAVGVFAIGLTAVVGWETLGRRLQQTSPYQDRQQMNLASLAMIRDHPWVGLGLGNWPMVYPKYAVSDDGLFANQAHNDWAQWTAEGGVLVLACMLFVFAWTLRRAHENIWCLGPSFLFIHAFFDYPFEKAPIAAIGFVLLAIAACEGSTVD